MTTPRRGDDAARSYTPAWTTPPRATGREVLCAGLFVLGFLFAGAESADAAAQAVANLAGLCLCLAAVALWTGGER